MDFRPIRAIRSKADVVFTRAKVAVFVDGCFWHGCPKHRTRPKTNSEYWSAKIEGNMDRDRRGCDELRRAGWVVVRFWEHEDMLAAADRIEALVRGSAPREADRPDRDQPDSSLTQP